MTTCGLQTASLLVAAMQDFTNSNNNAGINTEYKGSLKSVRSASPKKADGPPGGMLDLQFGCRATGSAATRSDVRRVIRACSWRAIARQALSIQRCQSVGDIRGQFCC